MNKFLLLVLSEIVEALFFICIILLVTNLKQNLPNYFLDASTIVGIWALAGIGTPFVIFMEEIRDILKQIR